MFYKRLCTLCEKSNCKPNTIAKTLNLSSATATKWKNGAIPNGETLVNIANFFNCSVDYLLGRTNNPTINNTPITDKDNIIDKFEELSDENKAKVYEYTSSVLNQQNEDSKIENLKSEIYKTFFSLSDENKEKAIKFAEKLENQDKEEKNEA